MPSPEWIYFIGKIVEFNAWNRTLTEEEHLKYSNCETYSEAKGNLMNPGTKWRNSNKMDAKSSFQIYL